jgi:hypothetical protein
VLVCIGFLVFILRSYDISEISGSGKPHGVYAIKTGNTNLRNHLRNVHGKEYDEAISRYNWPYLLSTQTRDASTQNDRNQRDPDVPSFSPAVFLEHLVRFIVADDQVSPNGLVFFHTHKSSVDPCCRMP